MRQTFLKVCILLQPRFDGVDDFVRCGSAGGKPYCFGAGEPRGVEISRGLNVMHARTVLLARREQLARVVAMSTTDDHHEIALAGEVNRGLLTKLGGLTDRVDKADFGRGDTSPHQGNEAIDAFDRLSGLGNDSKAGP